MTEGEFPFRSFTMRSEGYDRNEVDSYIAELQREIVELRRALETATPAGEVSGDTRLHDPEGAVTRTLAIAQETADRVLHDAQIEADRRRAEADEQAAAAIAAADDRAARTLADMETQAAEVREQGVAAARSAIQVERDKAMGELGHIRRVRDDLRSEATELKTMLDAYRSQAREASDTLTAVSSGPLTAVDLPAFVDDDVVLAGITTSVSDGDFHDYDGDDDFDDYDEHEDVSVVDDSTGVEVITEDTTDTVVEPFLDDPEDSDVDASLAAAADDTALDDTAVDDTAVEAGEVSSGRDGSHLRSVSDVSDSDVDVDAPEGPSALAEVIAIGGEDGAETSNDSGELFSAEDARETVIMEVPPRPSPPEPIAAASGGGDPDRGGPDSGDPDSGGPDDGGTFLAEVRAAASDDVALAPENDESDRFLSELRGLSGDDGDAVSGDAADTFFDDES